MSRRIRSDAITYGRHAETEGDNYVRCARCGFPCNLDRDIRAPEGSRLGWGIRYDGVYLDVTIEGGEIVDIGAPDDSAVVGIITEDGTAVLKTEDGVTLIP